MWFYPEYILCIQIKPHFKEAEFFRTFYFFIFIPQRHFFKRFFEEILPQPQPQQPLSPLKCLRECLAAKIKRTATSSIRTTSIIFSFLRLKHHRRIRQHWNIRRNTRIHCIRNRNKSLLFSVYTYGEGPIRCTLTPIIKLQYLQS